MSGDPTKASIWNDADVYVAPLGTPIPSNINEKFGSAWGLVGLLDGDDGIPESRDMSSDDFFAWGSILVRTARRQFVLTRKFTALEDNAVTAGLIWPGSTPTERFVPNLTNRFMIAFETWDGAEKRRVITTLGAEVDEVGDITDSESDLTKYEITVKIYPNGAKKLFDIQSTDTAATLVSIATTPATKSLAVGVYAPLTVTATFANNTTSDVSNVSSWSTTDATKASVDGKFVKGVATGTATVTATYQGKTASTAVTVTAT
jgi:hypothetical protein